MSRKKREVKIVNNINELIIGEDYTWKELCGIDIFKFNPKDKDNTKKSHIKEMERYFSFHKMEGKSLYIIDEVYSETKERKDNRKNNKGVIRHKGGTGRSISNLTKDIRTMLINYIYRQINISESITQNKLMKETLYKDFDDDYYDFANRLLNTEYEDERIMLALNVDEPIYKCVKYNFVNKFKCLGTTIKNNVKPVFRLINDVYCEANYQYTYNAIYDDTKKKKHHTLNENELNALNECIQLAIEDYKKENNIDEYEKITLANIVFRGDYKKFMSDTLINRTIENDYLNKYASFYRVHSIDRGLFGELGFVDDKIINKLNILKTKEYDNLIVKIRNEFMEDILYKMLKEDNVNSIKDNLDKYYKKGVYNIDERKIKDISRMMLNMLLDGESYKMKPDNIYKDDNVPF